VVADLLRASPRASAAAAERRLVADLGVSFAYRGRTKKLDMVIGSPKTELAQPSEFVRADIVRSEIAEPLLVLEVKACMTAHRQATTRLVDELRSTIDIVRGAAPKAAVGAVVIVNVAPQFTSPLKLPGPNVNRPADVVRLVRRVSERVGTLRADEGGYDVLSIVAVDFDNEKRIEDVEQVTYVPLAFEYPALIHGLAHEYKVRA
jgi:hypothetical protein